MKGFAIKVTLGWPNKGYTTWYVRPKTYGTQDEARRFLERADANAAIRRDKLDFDHCEVVYLRG